MLEVENLRREFHLRQGWRRHTLVAVNDVSLRLNRGRTVAVVGESGSGKSTLGRCIVWLLAPTRGQVRLDGVDLTGLSARAFSPYQRQLQMVFQDPGEALNPRLTVAAAIDEPLRFWQGLPRRPPGKALCAAGASPTRPQPCRPLSAPTFRRATATGRHCACPGRRSATHCAG